MKYKDIIEKRRDGTDRPLSEQHMLHSITCETICSACDQRAECVYEMQVDGFFCSDECRETYLSRSA